MALSVLLLHGLGHADVLDKDRQAAALAVLRVHGYRVVVARQEAVQLEARLVAAVLKDGRTGGGGRNLTLDALVVLGDLVHEAGILEDATDLEDKVLGETAARARDAIHFHGARLVSDAAVYWLLRRL